MVIKLLPRQKEFGWGIWMYCSCPAKRSLDAVYRCNVRASQKEVRMGYIGIMLVLAKRVWMWYIGVLFVPAKRNSDGVYRCNVRSARFSDCSCVPLHIRIQPGYLIIFDDNCK